MRELVELTVSNVHQAITTALYDPEWKKEASEPLDVTMEEIERLCTRPHTTVMMIVSLFVFDNEHLARVKQDVDDMLDQLPDPFHYNRGAGMSFLNANIDRKFRHWGEHRDMERLFALGIAIGRVGVCAPRDLWPDLPGGMPYYVVNARE